jgi:hypothetical protein
MAEANADWEARMARLWLEIDEHDETTFIDLVGNLSDELPSGSAIGLFERGSAFDSTGHSEMAVPLYRAALDAGLMGERRRRAVIQMASSLRNLGKAEESVTLLADELAAADDGLNGAVRAFLALALVDAGREREAVAVALTALSEYLPRYNRSTARYAKDLLPPPSQRDRA